MYFIRDVTLSLDTNAYTAGDVLAATQLATDFFRDVDKGAMLHTLTLLDKDDQKAALDVYLLDADVALGTENGVPAISDANSVNILAKIPFATGDYVDLGGVSAASLAGLSRILRPVVGTRSLAVGAINGAGTPTYTAAGLILRFGLEM